MAQTGERGTGYKRVFVALDGSEQQGKVLERATRLAANDGAALYVGHVVDSTALEAAGSFPADVIPALERSFRDLVADGVAAAEADPRIPEVHVLVKAGRVRETLKDDMLDDVRPDVVVCGARGLSSIKYAILGSISTFLARNAECDTLVVK